MSSAQTKWWNHPWSLVIGGVILTLILTDVYTKFNVWSTFVLILNYDIKAWFYGLSVISIVALNFYLKHRRHSIQLLEVPVSNTNELAQESVIQPVPIAFPPFDIDNIPIEILDAMDEDAERINNERIEKEQKMLAYTASKFVGFVWVWDWIKNPLINLYEVKNIKATCPNPECANNPLHLSWTIAQVTGHRCSICEVTHRVQAHTTEIENMIMDEVDKF